MCTKNPYFLSSEKLELKSKIKERNWSDSKSSKLRNRVVYHEWKHQEVVDIFFGNHGYLTSFPVVVAIFLRILEKYVF